MCICVSATTVSPTETDEPIEKLFDWGKLVWAQRTMNRWDPHPLQERALLGTYADPLPIENIGKFGSV